MASVTPSSLIQVNASKALPGVGNGNYAGGSVNPNPVAVTAPLPHQMTNPTPAATPAPTNTTQNIINQSNQEETTIANLLKTIQAQEQADAPGVIPSLNLNAINAQAQSQAASTVNPLYTQYLNQYLQEQSANQQAATAQNQLNIQGEQTGLQNTLEQNQLQESAAANTNALQQANINIQQQNYQLATGNAQTAKIQAIGQSIGSGNLGASGEGQQQLWQAENARNVADAAQSGQFQYQRNTSNLSAEDTFEQLAQNSLYAQTAEGEAEAQTNFNLNDYLRQAAYNDTQYQEALQASQQQALTATTQNLEATAIQNQLSALNPAGSKNYAAGETAYAPLLNASNTLPTAPNQSDYITAYGSNV